MNHLNVNMIVDKSSNGGGGGMGREGGGRFRGNGVGMSRRHQSI